VAQSCTPSRDAWRFTEHDAVAVAVAVDLSTPVRPKSHQERGARPARGHGRDGGAARL